MPDEPTAPDEPVYCRFGKRDLDGMSWLAPLVNNRIGDRLNLELRHEQLFFIQGDKVVEDIGYSEKGQRFSEADMGKPIRSLEDLKRNGYWLVGRAYDPEIMREALKSQQDGYYYSLFANQCQDWTDRLRRSAERIEKTRGLQPPQDKKEMEKLSHYSKPVSPTEPASIWLGLVAAALGAAAIAGPFLAGRLFSGFIALMFFASGGAHIGYSLHARDWRNMLPILLTALGCIAAGVLIVLNLQFAALATGTLVAVIIAVQGGSSILIGAAVRPLWRGLGSVAAGLLMIVCAIFITLRWPGGDNSLGLWVGLALTAGGWSTIWLSWTTRRADPSPSPA